MTRSLLLAIICALLSPTGSNAAGSPQQDKPNIVVILADDKY